RSGVQYSNTPSLHHEGIEACEPSAFLRFASLDALNFLPVRENVPVGIPYFLISLIAIICITTNPMIPQQKTALIPTRSEAANAAPVGQPFPKAIFVLSEYDPKATTRKTGGISTK